MHLCVCVYVCVYVSIYVSIYLSIHNLHTERESARGRACERGPRRLRSTKVYMHVQPLQQGMYSPYNKACTAPTTMHVQP